MPSFENYSYETNYSKRDIEGFELGDTIEFDGIDGFFDREDWANNNGAGSRVTALMCPSELPIEKADFDRLILIEATVISSSMCLAIAEIVEITTLIDWARKNTHNYETTFSALTKKLNLDLRGIEFTKIESKLRTRGWCIWISGRQFSQKGVILRSIYLYKEAKKNHCILLTDNMHLSYLCEYDRRIL